jgi:hypothetical protein
LAVARQVELGCTEWALTGVHLIQADIIVDTVTVATFKLLPRELGG